MAANQSCPPVPSASRDEWARVARKVQELPHPAGRPLAHRNSLCAVRAGLVDSAADWRWSSHQARIGKAHAEILDPCPMMLPVDWGEYVDQPLLESDLASLRRSVNRQAPYGSAQWQGEVSIEHGLQATLRPRGPFLEEEV